MLDVHVEVVVGSHCTNLCAHSYKHIRVHEFGKGPRVLVRSSPFFVILASEHMEMRCTTRAVKVDEANSVSFLIRTLIFESL